MKNNKITISDIAKELNVSAISVSRALSGQYGVSSELRDRILDKAKQMGYVRQKSSDDLNILILHQKPYLQDNSNFSLKIQAIEQAIQKVGAEYHIEYIEKDKQERMQLPCKLSKGSYFDGVIFIGSFMQEYMSFLKQHIKSQVIYSAYSPFYECDSVWYNFNNAGYKQCEYLIEKGHIHIGFVSCSKDYKNREKALGIVTALEKHDLPVTNEFFLYEEEALEDRVMELLGREQKPTALICQWDYYAIKLLKLFYAKGIRVPDDISIIGSGNTEMASISIPALTSMDINISYSCEAAVELLLKRINNQEKPIESIHINSTLIERDSVRSL